VNKEKTVNVKMEGVRPIQAESAERSVLGGMLNEVEVVDLAAERLLPNDFFNPGNKAIFSAMTELRAAGQAVDSVTVSQFLSDHKILDQVGGAGYVVELSMGVLSLVSVPTSIETVRTKAMLRDIQQMAFRAVYMVDELQHDPALVVQTVEKDLQAILNRNSQNAGAKRWMPAKDLVVEAIGAMETAIQRKASGLKMGLYTGLESLDYFTSGPMPGEFWVIAGLPGDGKSALALQFAIAIASKDKKGVGVVSLEMDRKEWLLRAFSGVSGVNIRKMREGSMTDGELLSIAGEGGWGDWMAGLPLFLEDGHDMNNLTIFRSACRKLKQEHDVACIIVDYIQLLSEGSADKKNRREEEVAAISRTIKALARELSIPIIGLAQLNRNAANGSPSIHHLRESGSLAADPDTVLLLSRQECSEDQMTEGLYPTTITIGKQRNGPAGIDIATIFQGRYCRFIESARVAK
jgi:replicative DNA helicase